ncbi:MAG: hypothetical protein JW849_02290 [Phycisphaerae bacterium]|nr:hypothetical protein [Phycisphaerae bacterium]
MNEMEELQQWLSPISSVVLVVVTGIYVWLTHKLLRHSIQEKQGRVRSALLSLFSELSMNEQVAKEEGNEAPRLSAAYDSCFWALADVGAANGTIASVCRAYVHIKWHKIAYEHIADNNGASLLAEEMLRKSIPIAVEAMKNDPKIKDIVKDIIDLPAT